MLALLSKRVPKQVAARPGDGPPRPASRRRPARCGIQIESLEARTLLDTGASHALLVAQVYRDLLGREAEPSGLSAWQGALDHGALTREAAILAIEASSEHQTRAVAECYQRLLHRLPDPAGWQGWTSYLTTGGTVEQLEAQFLGSPEYYTRSGGTDTAFLRAVYEHTLDREPDAAGLLGWGQLLAQGMSRAQVAQALLSSLEGITNEIADLYAQLLHRDADSTGLLSFIRARREQGVTREQVVARVGASAEYAAVSEVWEYLTVGIDAYVYGYPLVLMGVTERVATNVHVPSTLTGRAPRNQFGHVSLFPTPNSTDVVSPNLDTLYSLAWLDLSVEPLVLHVPEITGGRYYLMELLDAWTNVLAGNPGGSLGTRTTGNGEGNYMVVPPGWTGTLPATLSGVLYAPTNTVWIIGRTATTGTTEDISLVVNSIQPQYTLTPLSSYGGTYTPPSTVPIDPTVDGVTAPGQQVANMDAAAFFSTLAALLVSNPPAAADAATVAGFQRIGLVPGEPFDISQLSSQQVLGLQLAVYAAQKKIAVAIPLITTEVNHWHVSYDLGSYGTDYLIRAVAAHVGLGANLAVDAIYPSTSADGDGAPLNGAYSYQLHFDAGSLPPVNAFWSVTLYDADHFLVANTLARYSLNGTSQSGVAPVGRSDGQALTFNADGSLDIWIQATAPAAERVANWLPAPAGDFNLILRLYGPQPAALPPLPAPWQPPAVVRLS